MAANTPDRTVQYADVILALHVQAHGKYASNVFLALLSPEGLALSSISPLGSQDEKELQNQLQHAPYKVAASLVAEQMFGHLATQLFYADRWQEKLMVRLSDEK